MKDFLIFKPIKDKKLEPQYLKLLANIYGLNEQLVMTLHEHFKDEAYLIWSLFAGCDIKFKSIKELNELKIKLELYNEFKIKTSDSNMILQNVLDELSDKYKISSNQVFMFYKEVKEHLG